MDFWEKAGRGCMIGMIVFMVLALIVGTTPVGRYLWNKQQYAVEKVDDATNYHTRKQVEDTCRATIVSYEADRLTWLQYKDSESAEQRGWADAAKLRANKAALTYNEYFLKNSYVFSGNVPADIRDKLDILE